MAAINGLDAGYQGLNSVFENFGSTSDKNIIQEREKRLAGILSPELYAAYGNIAREGIYGTEGISKILNARRAAQALKTRQLSLGMRRGLGRRLGSRSGAVDTLIANQVVAPGLAESQGFMSDLLAKNLASRTYGIEGKQQLLGQLQQGVKNQWWKTGGGTGAMDIIGAGLDIAQMIPGPQQPVVAGASAATKLSGNSGSPTNRLSTSPFDYNTQRDLYSLY